MATWSGWRAVEGQSFSSLIYEKQYRLRNDQECGGVARILFNRPEAMNALGPSTIDELMNALLHANADRSVGVIVLSHVGDHFGVGGDVGSLVASADRGLVANQRGGLIPDTIIKRCIKPVVAAVRGYVIGMHHHMAYHCDFTIAGESAVFGQNGPRVGSPASGFIVANSAHLVGMKRARELWMRLRQLTAQEALEQGICNVVVQDRLLEEEVLKWCDDLLDRVPSSIAAIKQTFEMIGSELQYTDNMLQLVDPHFGEREERAEAGLSFRERRPPNFWTKDMIARRF